MSLPACPICGSEVRDACQQKVGASSMTKDSTEMVVYHCVNSHRFLALPNEHAIVTRLRGPADVPLGLGNATL